MQSPTLTKNRSFPSLREIVKNWLGRGRFGLYSFLILIFRFDSRLMRHYLCVNNLREAGYRHAV